MWVFETQPRLPLLPSRTHRPGYDLTTENSMLHVGSVSSSAIGSMPPRVANAGGVSSSNMISVMWQCTLHIRNVMQTTMINKKLDNFQIMLYIETQWVSLLYVQGEVYVKCNTIICIKNFSLRCESNEKCFFFAYQRQTNCLQYSIMNTVKFSKSYSAIDVV